MKKKYQGSNAEKGQERSGLQFQVASELEIYVSTYACSVLTGLVHDQNYYIIVYFCVNAVHRLPPALEMTPFEN